MNGTTNEKGKRMPGAWLCAIALTAMLFAAGPAWADDDNVIRVELAGTGDRGFCAGADVRVLRDAVLAAFADR